MHNAQIADAFDELADRLAIVDPKPYRWMAYRRAAATFREVGESVTVLSQEGRLGQIDGIGPAIEEKVATLLTDGTFPALEAAREQVPDTLLALTRLPGVGPATARKVHAATDGAPIDALMLRAAEGSLEPGDGITRKVIDALAAAHAAAAAGEQSTPGANSGVPLDDHAVPLPGPWFRRDQAHGMFVALCDLLPGAVTDPEPSGAYARGCELVQGLVVLATAADPAPTILEARATLSARGWELAKADTPRPPTLDGIPPHDIACASIVSPNGMGIDLAIATPAAAALARHRLAGPAAWVLHEPEPTAASTPIELRDRVLEGALAAADIPTDLVSAADLRGELHAHSDWSDGRATILEMARAARDRGDEYFCVCDHSAPYAMVNGLDPARLQAQADEIARVNEQLQREHEEAGEPLLRVLRGTELEILADGTLGLPDSALARLDWVVASIHTQQRQPAAAILERMRRVLANPLVDAIGHPTSRRLLVRERTALDVQQLIAMAVEHEVALEINANPDRLDLDSTHAAAAHAAGARLTINTDAHRPEHLALRMHGVAVARRAGVPRSAVVNCLPADALLATRRRDR